jgi:hypothetical protein
MNEFRRQHGRYPYVREMPNQEPGRLQAQRAVETGAANNAQNIYERAVAEIQAASFSSDRSLMGEHARYVSDVYGGVGVHGYFNNFGRISFERIIDLIYHWQKHKEGQQTLRDYVDQINQYLTQAITGGNFRIEQRTGQLSIRSDTHVLIVYVKNHKGYAKTFYKKD